MRAMRRTKQIVLGAGMLFILGGCPSYLTMQSTRTVEPGQLEVSGAAGRLFTFGGTGVFSNLTGLIGPTQLEGAARFGIVPNLDLGVRLRLADLGVSGGMKLRFLNLEKLQMAVLGEIGTSLWAPIFNALSSAFLEDRGISIWLYWIDAAILAGLPISADNLLFFGPKFKMTNYTLNNVSAFFGGTGGSGSVSVSSFQVQPGLVVGVDMNILKGGTRVLPEVDAFYDISTRAFILQVGVSVALGGHKKENQRRKEELEAPKPDTFSPSESFVPPPLPPSEAAP